MLSEKTGRATILYATAWLDNKPGVSGDVLSIGLGDIQGFMEAVSNVTERELDLVLHSPGGSAEAADSIMGYLRTRFDHIRVIVPVAAMASFKTRVEIPSGAAVGSGTVMALQPLFIFRRCVGGASATATFTVTT